MREDEEFTKNAIVKHLGNIPDIIVSEGENPPDYYISIGPEKVALEVTQLSSVYLSEDGSIGNRSTVEESLMQFYVELSEHFKFGIPADTSLFLCIKGPVSNPRVFKKGIKNAIKEYLSFNTSQRGSKSFVVDGEVVEISKTKRKRNERSIDGTVLNKRPIYDIGLQARIILNNVIQKKTNDFVRDQYYKGEKWLGLLNDYQLADSETYLLVMKNLEVVHCFSKIFLISGDGRVTPIFSVSGDGILTT